MAQIDMGLLILVVVAIIAVIGTILALQTNGGRKRFADAALRLAESLIAYAIKWMEGRGTGTVDVPAGVPAGVAMNDRVVRAKTALAILRG